MPIQILLKGNFNGSSLKAHKKNQLLTPSEYSAQLWSAYVQEWNGLTWEKVNQLGLFWSWVQKLRTLRTFNMFIHIMSTVAFKKLVKVPEVPELDLKLGKMIWTSVESVHVCIMQTCVFVIPWNSPRGLCSKRLQSITWLRGSLCVGKQGHILFWAPWESIGLPYVRKGGCSHTYRGTRRTLETRETSVTLHASVTLFTSLTLVTTSTLWALETKRKNEQ